MSTDRRLVDSRILSLWAALQKRDYAKVDQLCRLYLQHGSIPDELAAEIGKAVYNKRPTGPVPKDDFALACMVAEVRYEWRADGRPMTMDALFEEAVARLLKAPGFVPTCGPADPKIERRGPVRRVSLSTVKAAWYKHGHFLENYGIEPESVTGSGDNP